MSWLIIISVKNMGLMNKNMFMCQLIWFSNYCEACGSPWCAYIRYKQLHGFVQSEFGLSGFPDVVVLN